MNFQNTFTGANLHFKNRGIHYLLAEIMQFRAQLTVREEFRAMSGWDDSVNNWMVEELNKLARTLQKITYSPSTLSKEELEANAADPSRTLIDDYDSHAIATDDTVMPVGTLRPVVWDLTGTAKNYPQPTLENGFENDHGRAFVVALDNLFVELTRLDSRHNSQTITKDESKMMRNLILELFTICQEKGGEANKSNIPTGTLPSEKPNTFNADGTHDPKSV